MPTCKISGCTNEISAHSRLEECPACRAYLVSYLKSSPARTYQRRQKIHLYDSRLQVIMPGKADALDENAALRAPKNYKPQSKKGKAVLRSSVKRTSVSAHA